MNGTPLSNHYTLPGVMHYLQTEFTKNERDRINWELERCEMKCKIAKLEGENRDLRYQLLKLQNNDASNSVKEEPEFSESSLIRAKASVQENVKEIVYLLKNPNITEQLDSWSNKQHHIHNLEKLNLNGDDSPLPINSAYNGENCSSKLLKFYQNHMLSVENNKDIKFKSMINNEGTKYFENSKNILNIFWLDSERFITIEQQDLKLWNINKLMPIYIWNLFSSFYIPSVKIEIVDFKNKWLLFKFANKIFIWKLQITSTKISKLEELEIKLQQNSCMNCCFGITENSIIVFYGNPFYLQIYSFQGSSLQRVDLSKMIPLNLPIFDLELRSRMLINKQASQLLIQISNYLLIYSFDQKSIKLIYLSNNIENLLLIDSKNWLLLMYADSIVEVRSLNELDKILKTLKRDKSIGNYNNGIEFHTADDLLNNNEDVAYLQKLLEFL